MNITPQLSFVPGEILAAGTRLSLTVRNALDPQSVRDGIRLTGSTGSDLIHVDAIGTRIELDTAELGPGSYLLEIDELRDRRGAPVVLPSPIPFEIGEFTGAVPDELRVEHLVHLRVGETEVDRVASPTAEDAGGQVISVLKAVHRKGGAAVDLAFDADGAPIDAETVLAEVGARRHLRFGVADAALWAELDAADDDTRIDVAVWPTAHGDVAIPERSVEEPTLEAPQEQKGMDARWHESLRLVESALLEHGADVVDEFPFVTASLPAEQVRKLAFDERIGALFIDDRTAVLDLQDSIHIARSDTAHALGVDGSGIRVAVFEDGPKNTTDLVLTDRFTTTPASSDHARLTHAVIRNAENGHAHGHAPGADLYSANSSDNAALRWAARQGCTVISQSFHRMVEPHAATPQSDDLLKDWLAVRWPYPTIVQAAGNYWQGDDDDVQPPADEYVNHKGFNTIAVGNHDDTASAMDPSSVFRNPTSTHNDRELPEISANGTGVTALGITMTGTSFAAPAVAGVTALIQQAAPVLQSWPEGCRAILLAGARRNITGRTWWADVAADADASDGTGAVDAAEGVRIARARRRSGAEGSSRGWDIGTLRSSDVGRDGLVTSRHRITVPRRSLLPHVKVALAWDSHVGSIFGIPLGSRLSVDLDLLVRDAQGRTVASSASWDNSYEIAEFAAVPGASYEIAVRRWSGTDDVWFGLAWSTTTLAFAPPPTPVG